MKRRRKHWPPILGYAQSPEPRPWPRWATLQARVVVTPIAMIIASFFVPVPRGFWYFGPGDQWFIATYDGGLMFGTSTSFHEGAWLLLALRCFVIAVSAWAMWKCALWRRRKRSAQTNRPAE